MRAVLGKLAQALVPALARSLLNARTLAYGYGQVRSIRALEPVDAAGAPIPWYTYPAIEFLKQFDMRANSVFEFGGGNSSRFWAARAARVTAVETDPAWYAALTAERIPNLSVHLRREKAAYVSCVAEQNAKFDLIVIDGQWRRSCANLAPMHLAEGGLIVLDNADWYPDSARGLRAAGFYEIDFSGFGPVNAYTWTTSVFLRADARLQKEFASARPIGGLLQQGDDV